MIAAHLAQINVATLRAPMDDPATVDFAAGLDPVNAAGDAAPGFVWRLADDTGNATAIQHYEDPLRIVNLTVWESIEALRAFALGGIHRDFLRRRGEWFDPAKSATALWWVPTGTIPTVEDAERRLAFLAEFDSTPHSFAMSKRHPQLVIARTPLADPVAQGLILRLNTELAEMYPEPGANHFNLAAAEVDGAAGGFFVAWLDGQPVGCGAFRMIEPNVAEVKRMFVDPDVRGVKLGAALLDVIEGAAIAAGAAQLVLETGTRQHAALGLYARLGFTPVPAWGEYLDSPTSVCLGKPIAPLLPTS